MLYSLPFRCTKNKRFFRQKNLQFFFSKMLKTADYNFNFWISKKWWGIWLISNYMTRCKKILHNTGLFRSQIQSISHLWISKLISGLFWINIEHIVNCIFWFHFSWLDMMSATSKEMEAVIIDVSVHILQVLRKVTINIEEKL